MPSEVQGGRDHEDEGGGMMNIYLGDLSTQDIERRLGITLSDQDRDIMESMRQNQANDIKPDKWHCFDIPFLIKCGDKDTAIRVRDILKQYEGQMNSKIGIGW